MKGFIKFFITLVLTPLKYLPRDSKIIILQTYSPQIYCENTKYLYEYLSENSDFRPYFVTDNPKVQEYLDKKGFLYITKRKPFELINVACRAKFVFDTGNAFFNIFNLLNTKNVIKITTMHGSGPKATNGNYDSLDRNLAETFKLNQFDYVNFPSEYSAIMVGRAHFKLPSSKVVSLGYPRVDSFQNTEFVLERFSQKKYVKNLFQNFKESSKVILYTPTWRPYDYKFPLLELSSFSLEKFENFLEENNLYFVYSCHTANIPQNIPKNGKRIRYLEHKDDPFFDINLFMLEVDILMNDYSTTSTEFSILKRPQFFFMPDFDFYFGVKGFIEDYKKLAPGNEIFSYDDLEQTLLEIKNNETQYMNKYENSRVELLDKYYDVNVKNSGKEFLELLNSIRD